MREGGKRAKKAEPREDTVIAEDRLRLLRYFASGLIVGGAGVCLTLVLGAVNVQGQSVMFFRGFYVVLMAGSLWASLSAIRWIGIRTSKLFITLSILFLLYQAVGIIATRPHYVFRSFSGPWWSLIVDAVFAIVFGAGFRYFADMELDDLQYVEPGK